MQQKEKQGLDRRSHLSCHFWVIEFDASRWRLVRLARHQPEIMWWQWPVLPVIPDIIQLGSQLNNGLLRVAKICARILCNICFTNDYLNYKSSQRLLTARTLDRNLK